MRFLKIGYQIFAGIIGCVLTIHAQNTNLSGTVVDFRGVPVVGATVVLSRLHHNCTTDSIGHFQIQANAAVKNPGSRRNDHYIGIRNNLLTIADNTNAIVTVFSMRGSILNSIVLNKQKYIILDKLISKTLNSQAVIISIETEDHKVFIKAVKCGRMWLSGGQGSGYSGETKTHSVAAVVVDTLTVAKSGKMPVTVPLSSLIDTLDEIVMYDSGATQTGMIGDILFSVPSKTFKGSVSVTLTTKINNAEIRYTTDGLVPIASSSLYNGNALTISKTTQLRAAAFVTGVMTGSSSTAIYILRNFDYTSDAPIIIMEGYGNGKPKDKYNFIDLAFMAFEPVNGVASLDNIPTLVTRAGYHLRGQSSLMLFKQAPYRIEFWDNIDKDADYPVLGMPAGSDWALVSPCTDNSLIRNVFGFELGKSMGLATVQYRFAEVFINQDGGAVMKDDYEGIYTLIQSIKNKKNTLDLKKLKPDETDPEKISGGYILKFEWAVNDTDMLLLECKGAPKISNSSGGYASKPVDPSATCFDGLELSDPTNPNQQQIAWITNYIQDLHDALHTKTIDEWQKYIDVNSVVGIHLLNEISCDVDAWRRSHYFYKDRGEALKAGPVWDYNFAFGNFTSTTNGWHCDKQTIASNDWHKQMWKQQDFRHVLKLRYSELRKSVLSDGNIDKIIQDIINPIKNIGQRNFEAWPMGKCSSMSSGGGWGGGSTFRGDTTWSGQIDSLKIWTKKRLKNLDSCTAALP